MTASGDGRRFRAIVLATIAAIPMTAWTTQLAQAQGPPQPPVPGTPGPLISGDGTRTPGSDSGDPAGFDELRRLERSAQKQLAEAHDRAVATIEELERRLEDEQEQRFRRIVKMQNDLTKARRIRDEMESLLNRNSQTSANRSQSDSQGMASVPPAPPAPPMPPQVVPPFPTSGVNPTSFTGPDGSPIQALFQVPATTAQPWGFGGNAQVVYFQIVPASRPNAMMMQANPAAMVPIAVPGGFFIPTSQAMTPFQPGVPFAPSSPVQPMSFITQVAPQPSAVTAPSLAPAMAATLPTPSGVSIPLTIRLHVITSENVAPQVPSSAPPAPPVPST